jgi:hypothetical protein
MNFSALEFVAGAFDQRRDLLVVAVAIKEFLPVGKLGLQIAGDRIQPGDQCAEQFLHHGGMNGLRRVLDEFEAHRLLSREVVPREVGRDDQDRADLVGVDLA